MPAGQLDTGIATAFGFGLSGVLREGVEIVGIEEGIGVDTVGVEAGVERGAVVEERKGEEVVKARIGREGRREDPFRRQVRQIIVVVGMKGVPRCWIFGSELKLKKFGCGPVAGLGRGCWQYNFWGELCHNDLVHRQ